MQTTIDLNADLGEHPGDAEPLLPYITTANIAAGGHAGGGDLLHDTVALCASRNIRVGAHPSYPDRDNFGRLSLYRPETALEHTQSITDQVRLVASAALRHGIALSHVKAHGALYNDAMTTPPVADLLLNALAGTGLHLPIMGQPGSVLEAAARSRGIPFIAEGFLDRAYTIDGTLAPRNDPGAVHHDIATILKQARSLIFDQAVLTTTGEHIPMHITTLCVHADTPGAAQSLAAVHTALRLDGITISAPA